MDIVLLGAKYFWKLPFCRLELIKLIKELCKDLPLKSLEVLLVQDSTMAEINEKYMGCHGITNVLSFTADICNDSGSLVVSVDTVSRESFLYGQNISVHYIRLLTHGIGHILGYEHGVEMDTFCDKLLKQVNVC